MLNDKTKKNYLAKVKSNSLTHIKAGVCNWVFSSAGHIVPFLYLTGHI